MDGSLYIPLEQCEQIDKIVDDIKANLNERLINEMKYIIREYNKTKKKRRGVGRISKKIDNYNPPNLTVDFD